MEQIYYISPNIYVSLLWHSIGSVSIELNLNCEIVEKRRIVGWENEEEVFATVVSMASDYADRVITPETLDLYHQVLAWYQEECFW